MKFCGRLRLAGVILSGIMSALCAGLVTPAHAEDLAQAMNRALAHAPDLRSAGAGLDAARQLARQARGAWLPSVDVTIGSGRENSDNLSSRATGGPQTLSRREKEVAATQLLFDGGATSGQVARFDAKSGAALTQLLAQFETTAARTAQAYLDVLRMRAQADLAREHIVRHQETLQQVALLADAGKGRRADVMQAQARLALAQSSASQLRGQLLQAEETYRYLTAMPPPQLDQPASLHAELPASFTRALAQAVDTHPGMRAAEFELQAAQAERDSQKSRLLSPRVTAEAGRTDNRDASGIPGVSASNYLMLRMRYNLSRGGIDNAKVAEAQARVDEAVANLARTGNEVERDLRQAWDGLQEDRQRLPELERYVNASGDVVQAYRAQFMIGSRTLLDVLNAESELNTARSTLFAGRQAVSSGEIKVLAAMGRLVDTMKLRLPDQLLSPKQARQ